MLLSRSNYSYQSIGQPLTLEWSHHTHHMLQQVFRTHKFIIISTKTITICSLFDKSVTSSTVLGTWNFISNLSYNARTHNRSYFILDLRTYIYPTDQLKLLNCPVLHNLFVFISLVTQCLVNIFSNSYKALSSDLYNYIIAATVFQTRNLKTTHCLAICQIINVFPKCQFDKKMVFRIVLVSLQ